LISKFRDWFACLGRSKKYGNKGAKAKAIEHCQKMMRDLPHYREALQLDGPQA